MERQPIDSFFSADARVMQSSLIRQLTGLVNRSDIISFAAGSPNAEVFPYRELVAIFNDLVAHHKGQIFQYSVTRGIAELIEAVRERLESVKRIAASTEETILTSGSQQALDLAGRVLLDPGDVVFVERPNYIGATAAFQNFRAEVIGVDRAGRRAPGNSAGSGRAAAGAASAGADAERAATAVQGTGPGHSGAGMSRAGAGAGPTADVDRAGSGDGRGPAGIDLDALRSAVRRARAAGKTVKFVYVIPNFQNPSGHTWSVASRRGLLELAAEEDFLIFEDDAYGEVYFSGADPAALLPIKSFEDGETRGRVLYMSTFSKILVPGLRVAWIAGHSDIIRRIELAKETADLCTSTLSQRLILEYLRRGHADSHLETVRRFYDHKCSMMQRSLSKHFGDLGRWTPPLGGLFLWVELQAAVDTLPLLKVAVEQEKVAYIPGSPFFVEGGGASPALAAGANTVRLSFSNASDENIERGVERLSTVFAAAAEALHEESHP